MRRIFAMLLPIIFPVASPGALDITALMQVTNSGREVPIAMIVSPMINGGTFNCLAKDIAPLIIKSAPPTSIKRPKER